MAAGIRIEPQPGRLSVPDNQMIVLRDQSRKFQPDPLQICRICGYPHDCKTYHLQLVGGAVIVSTTIWDRLQDMPDHGGFQEVNVVEAPPAQGLNLEHLSVVHFNHPAQQLEQE